MNQETRHRLATLLPRLGSSFEGEAAATAAAIVRVLRADGFDLHDFAAFVVHAHDPPEWSALVAQALRHGLAATDDEVDFLRTMERYAKVGREPSEKQLKWLRDIAGRQPGERRPA